MVVNKRWFTFQQNGAPAHTSKHAQDWCLQNLPSFINKDDWLGNSPDYNTMENLFSILNEQANSENLCPPPLSFHFDIKND